MRRADRPGRVLGLLMHMERDQVDRNAPCPEELFRVECLKLRVS